MENFEQNNPIRILPSKIQSKFYQGHTAVLKNIGLYLIATSEIYSEIP